jgi:hypothetical protein
VRFPIGYDYEVANLEASLKENPPYRYGNFETNRKSEKRPPPPFSAYKNPKPDRCYERYE